MVGLDLVDDGADLVDAFLRDVGRADQRDRPALFLEDQLFGMGCETMGNHTQSMIATGAGLGQPEKLDGQNQGVFLDEADAAGSLVA